MQQVTLGMSTGNLMQIKSGITAGERVVTEGVLKLQPDTPVRTGEASQQATAKK